MWQVLALVLASCGTSFMTAALGIGGGVTLIVILATVLPPAVLIPVHGVVQLGSNLGRVLMMVRYILPTVLLPYLLGSLVGAVAGGLIVVDLPATYLQIGLAAFILWSVWGRLPVLEWRYVMPLGGMIASFLTMFFGTTAPFVASVIKTLKLERMAHVSTMAACMVMQHGLKIIVFGFLGFAFAPYLGFIAMMIAAGLIGTWLGKHLLLRIDDKKFHMALNVLLTVLALELLWRGLRGVLA
ncbi:MAG: sulfite exporter TauE/SafE family protein [Pseudomonadota bacterium]